MNDYQQFFNKRRKLAKGGKNPVKEVRKNILFKKYAAVVFTTALMGAALVVLLDEQDRVTKLLSKVEISFFGAAEAETKADKPQEKNETKGEKQNAETKDATGEKSTAENHVAPEVGPKSWSPEEVALFTKLEARKKQLDARELELQKMDEELQKTKEEIEKRLAQLDDVRKKISSKLDEKVKVDQGKVDSLVSVYANMKPSQAAKVIEEINEDLAVEVLAKMKNKSAAEILNLMNAEKAKKLSERFAGYREPAVAP